MKKVFSTLFLLTFLLSSCVKDPNFDTDEWWPGHWERVGVNNEFFSSGHGRQGPQLYFSTLDTINKHLYFNKLLDFSNKERWKLIQTHDGQYLKIVEKELEQTIEVIGPAESRNELGVNGILYMFKKGFVHPLIPDSLMYGR